MREVKMPYDIYVALVKYFICEDEDTKRKIVDWIYDKNDSLQRHEAYSEKFKES